MGIVSSGSEGKPSEREPGRQATYRDLPRRRATSIPVTAASRQADEATTYESPIGVGYTDPCGNERSDDMLSPTRSIFLDSNASYSSVSAADRYKSLVEATQYAEKDKKNSDRRRPSPFQPNSKKTRLKVSACPKGRRRDDDSWSFRK